MLATHVLHPDFGKEEYPDFSKGVQNLIHFSGRLPSYLPGNERANTYCLENDKLYPDSENPLIRDIDRYLISHAISVAQISQAILFWHGKDIGAKNFFPIFHLSHPIYEHLIGKGHEQIYLIG